MLKDLCAAALFPTEISSMLRLKFGGYVRPLRPEPLETLAGLLNDIDFCYAVLNKVSRSFAVVIQQLPQELQDPVCIFYLVLRGLDSVEDDMTFDVEKKLKLLPIFYEKLDEPGWTIENVGDSDDYRVLLKHFDKVIRIFQAMQPKYRAVISDITKRMGCGMAEYVDTTTGKTKIIDSVSGYNQYCHYVAGLVGHGLSALFYASGLESNELTSKKCEGISNSMGLFLQKTNIIRDYLEDLREQRTWWPKEIWGKYGETLDEFAEAPKSAKSLACLNHMVTDALALVPECLEYLSKIHDRKIFEFCAIPQVMAMATLELCYNNSRILSQTSVKIRKGLSCKLMLNSSTQEQVHGWFYAFAQRLGERIPQDDPNAPLTRKYVDTTLKMTKSNVEKMLLGPATLTPKRFQLLHQVAWSCLAVGVIYLGTRAGAAGGMPTGQANTLLGDRTLIDTSILTACTLAAGYLGGFFGLQFV